MYQQVFQKMLFLYVRTAQNVRNICMKRKKIEICLPLHLWGEHGKPKGYRMFQRRFSNLNSINSNTKLNIVGKDNLSNDIKEKYSENIDYMGQQLHSRIPEILMQTDIVLFPSLSDGLVLQLLKEWPRDARLLQVKILELLI